MAQTHGATRVVKLGRHQWMVMTWDATVSAWRDSQVYATRREAQDDAQMTREWVTVAGDVHDDLSQAGSVSDYMAEIGRKGGSAKTAAKAAASRANGMKPKAPRETRRVIYEAIGRLNGRDAGHICYGRTKDEAYVKSTKSDVSRVVRRTLASQAEIDNLARVGKL